MKKLLTTVLLLCILPCCIYAQDSVVTQSQVDELADAMQSSIDLKTADISDSLRHLTDSFYALKHTLSVSDYYDSMGVAALKVDASPLYAKGACSQYDWIYKWLGWLLFIAVLISGFLLLQRSSICRDDSYDAQGNLRPLKQRSFSYSRVQLFWWTMIILCCYIAFFALTGNLVPLNMTTIMLLGLGSVVYGAGVVIDSRQKKTALGSRVQDADASDDDFFTDILSDDNGISIHRFQTVVFNIVFGIGFVSYFVSAYCAHKYPFAEFNEWQLALLGISSATYLGMKAAENGGNTPAGGNAVTEQEATRNLNQ